MNALYRDLFSERIAYALRAAQAVAPLEHSGVKGAIREVLTADLFRPLLPADIGVATGVIISSYEARQSAQQDIIIFDKRILPPVLFEQGPAIIPVESALAVVEVKSKLTATELKTAHENALTLRSLGMTSGIQDDSGNYVDVPTSGVTPILFALATDLTPDGQSEKDRYVAYFGNEVPVVRGICVAGRASWWPASAATFDHKSGTYRTPDGAAFGNEWTEVKTDAYHAEVLELLAGLHALIGRVANTRGRPPMTAYVRSN